MFNKPWHKSSNKRAWDNTKYSAAPVPSKKDSKNSEPAEPSHTYVRGIKEFILEMIFLFCISGFIQNITGLPLRVIDQGYTVAVMFEYMTVTALSWIVAAWLVKRLALFMKGF